MFADLDRKKTFASTEQALDKMSPYKGCQIKVRLPIDGRIALRGGADR